MTPCTCAQRRPGHQPRRHAATVRISVPTWRTTLNEGQGISPGDTRRLERGEVIDDVTASTLNEGQGISPGDTRIRVRIGRENARPATLNEGQGISPGDTGAETCDRQRAAGPLNEGQGISPGDTTARRRVHVRSSRSTKARASAPATRHVPIGQRHGDGPCRRSTKARASAPATRNAGLAPLTDRPAVDLLNEGQGISPGDTLRKPLVPERPASTATRSTKARASAPATRRPTTATTIASASSSLNEGQGISPGDTWSARRSRSQSARSDRSTKARASAPATHSEEQTCPSAGLTVGRAQRRPGHQPRRH